MESSNDDDSKSSIKSGTMQVGLDTNGQGLMTTMKNNSENQQGNNLTDGSDQDDEKSHTIDTQEQTTMKNNNENDQPKHPTSREWVKTDTDEKKKEWWKEFIFGVKRKWNENLCKGVISGRLIEDKWELNEQTIIGSTGNLYLSGFKQGNDDTIWDYDGVNNHSNDNHGYNKYPISTIMTEKNYKTLCRDLGTKLGDYEEMLIGGFLTKIYLILHEREQMPKVRHRHKFLFWGNDKKSKTDGRWLADFIDDSKKQEVFGKNWGEIGNNEDARKEYLIKCAKPEKRKELAKLLKYKGNLKDLFRDENTATPPPVVATPQPQTAETPTVTMPPSVEKIKLYHGASQEWKKKLPWWDRFSDWLNRKWFRFRFKNEIYNDEAGYKAAYRNYCHRDWDTGRDAGGINR